MSHKILFYIDAPSPLEEFVKELQALLEVEFEQRSEERSSGLDIWYEALPQRIWLEVFENKLTELDDVPYKYYRFVIRRRGGINYWVERERRLYEYARFLFDRLKEQGRHRIMFDDDAQNTPEMFSPDT